MHLLLNILQCDSLFIYKRFSFSGLKLMCVLKSLHHWSGWIMVYAIIASNVRCCLLYFLCYIFYMSSNKYFFFSFLGKLIILCIRNNLMSLIVWVSFIMQILFVFVLWFVGNFSLHFFFFNSLKNKVYLINQIS